VVNPHILPGRFEKIPQLGGEYGARARSATAGYTLYFPNIPKISHANHKFASFQSDRAKYSG